MIKTKTIETIEEYNDSGKLVKKTTTETTEENDAKENWYAPNYWWSYPNPNQPTVACSAGTGDVPLQTTVIYSSERK